MLGFVLKPARMNAKLKCLFLLLFLGVCAHLVSADGGGESEERENMEHLFPLLFLMGGTPTVHCPAVWLLGTLMLGATYFMAKIKNL